MATDCSLITEQEWKSSAGKPESKKGVCHFDTDFCLDLFGTTSRISNVLYLYLRIHIHIENVHIDGLLSADQLKVMQQRCWLHAKVIVATPQQLRGASVCMQTATFSLLSAPNLPDQVQLLLLTTEKKRFMCEKNGSVYLKDNIL